MPVDIGEIVNLVFEGGSVKGVGHVGALLELEANGFDMRQVQRVGGTSAGSIMAALIAVGYSVTELRDLMFGTDNAPAMNFMDFVPDENLFRVLDGGTELASAVTNTAAARERGGISGNVSSVFQGTRVATAVTPLVTPLIGLMTDLSRKTGVVKGDAIREFIETKISEKLLAIYQEAYAEAPEDADRFKYCTFSMLKDFRQELLDNGADQAASQLKYLRVFAFNIAAGRVEEFSPEASPLVIISDAVRASMAIPFVFCPQQRFIRIEDDDGRPVRVPMLHTTENDDGDGEEIAVPHLYVDGGIVRNFPIETFDEDVARDVAAAADSDDPDTIATRVANAVANATFGFSLANRGDVRYMRGLEDFPTATTSLTGGLMAYSMAVWGAISGAEFRELAASDENKARTVFIDTCGVGMMDFDLDIEAKTELYESGRKAVCEYYGVPYNPPAVPAEEGDLVAAP